MTADPWGPPDPNAAWQPGAPGPGDPDRWSFFPPPGEHPPLWEPPPRPPWIEVWKPHAATFGLTAVVLVLLGAPFALLWRAVAPTAVVVRTASGPQPLAPESNQMFAVDGWFVLLSAVAGLVLGGVAWLLLRERGPAAPFGLAIGGLAAAAVAAAVGKRMVVDRYLHDVCGEGRCLVYDGTLHLHATAAIVVLPTAMLTAFALLSFFLEKEHA